MKCNPFPTVTFDGDVYKLRSRNTVVPDLAAMDEMAAHLWLCQNTWPKGYQREANPLIGLGGAITVDPR
jgi:hypothetical protein